MAALWRDEFCSRFHPIQSDAILIVSCRVRATIVLCESNLRHSGGIGANHVKNIASCVSPHNRFLHTIHPIQLDTIYVSFLSNPNNRTCFNFNIHLFKLQNLYLHVTHSSFSIDFDVILTAQRMSVVIAMPRLLLLVLYVNVFFSVTTHTRRPSL